MVYSVEEISARILPVIREYRIKAVYLFGSYARGTANESSDVDLLIDTEGSVITGLVSLGGLYSDLEEALKKRVDLVTVSSVLQPTSKRGQLHFRENLMKERIELYVA